MKYHQTKTNKEKYFKIGFLSFKMDLKKFGTLFAIIFLA